MKRNKNRWIKNLTALVLGGIMTVSLNTTVFARQMSLSESINEALANNHTIKEQEASLISARAVLGEARGNEGLTLTWEGTAYKADGHSYHDSGINRLYGNTIKATVPIYTGGKLENNKKSASLGVEIAQYNLDNEKQTIQYQTIEDYYAILNYINIKKVDETAVKQYSEHEKVAEAKYNAGVVAKTDLLTAQVNLANAKQALVTAENNVQVAITTFNTLIGQDILTDVEPADNYLTDTNYSKTLQECMDTAVQNRPDLLAAQRTVEQEQKAIAAAKAGYLPQVDFVAQKYISGNNVFDNDQYDQSIIGILADWTIFDSAVTHSQVKQAEAAYMKAQHTELALKDTVLSDVRQAYLSMEAARKNIETTKIAVVQAEEDNRIAVLRYQAGVGTNSDRLDAISNYATAQTNYNEALYTYTTSRASLEKAMGMPIMQNNSAVDDTKDSK
ncbi:TolC family protein [Pectinatus brassicae]|uniref:Outer membrane protein TolC n=1 Tax=Pectinatus brassicae TaxID=862415 RepID=A0A840UV91_9FIRM|nr:TolC family protein [Pectinatus brassicae]MBB5336365.1 outer membrane protein TolC [Pectinatus brassicae]